MAADADNHGPFGTITVNDRPHKEIGGEQKSEITNPHNPDVHIGQLQALHLDDVI
ncbi:hypothetical protein D3C73_1582580 [compost metagenome]